MPREDDLDSDDSEETSSPVPAPAASAPRRPAPAPAAQKKRTLAGPPDDAPSDALELWPWILESIHRQGVSPYQVKIQVVQVAPPDPVSMNGYQVGVIAGGAVMGSDQVDPSEALVNYIVNYIHLPRAAAAHGAKYSLRFSWATNSQQFKRGELVLPPRSEILAMRSAQEHGQQTQPAPGVGAPPMMQPPPVQPPYPYAPSYPPPSPYGLGAPEQMLDMMREMWRASIEQRPPVMPAGMVPPGAIASPPMNEDALVQKTVAGVLAALQKLDVVPRPPPAIAPPVASPPPPTGIAAIVERTVGRVVEAAVGEVERSMRNAITGAGRARDDYDDEDTAPQPTTPAQVGVGAVSSQPQPPPKPEPEEVLPWKTQPVADARWSDGRPIVYAEDNETGKISPMGVIMSNPIIMERGLDVGLGFVNAIKDAITRVGQQASAPLGAPPVKQIRPEPVAPQVPASQVVSETPADAIDANLPSWKA